MRRTNRGPEASQKASPNRSDELTPTIASCRSSTVLMKCACPITTLASSGLSTGTTSQESVVVVTRTCCHRHPTATPDARNANSPLCGRRVRLRVPRTARHPWRCPQRPLITPKHRQLPAHKVQREITAGSSSAAPPSIRASHPRLSSARPRFGLSEGFWLVRSRRGWRAFPTTPCGWCGVRCGRRSQVGVDGGARASGAA